MFATAGSLCCWVCEFVGFACFVVVVLCGFIGFGLWVGRRLFVAMVVGVYMCFVYCWLVMVVHGLLVSLF